MRTLAALGLCALLSGCETPAPRAIERPIVEYTVVVRDYQFFPEELRIPRGERVRVTFVSEDREYAVVMSGYGRGYQPKTAPFEPGTPGQIEFSASAVNEYPYRCWLWCGRGHKNMQGKIVVYDPEKEKTAQLQNE